MTFSIVGRCDATGQFGIAVASSSPAVAARCAYARAGIGAVASQNVTDPRLGSHTLDAMASGLNADVAISSILATASHTARFKVGTAGVLTAASGSPHRNAHSMLLARRLQEALLTQHWTKET